jgi:predicted RNase H-like HicB family nuclease
MAAIHIPYSIEQDEDGWFCAYAPFVTDEVQGGANGAGRTPEEAIADLREALEGCVAQFGVPHSARTIVTLTVQDAA